MLPYSSLAKGTFLVASPETSEGLFFRSVILICEHSQSGSFGLIINKKLQLELPEEILDFSQLTNKHVSIQAGGPLQTNQMMLLHSSEEIPEQTLNICEGVYLGGDLDFLQKVISEEEGPSVRLCFGYMGWGPGQLEHEFLEGEWYLAPGNAKHVFSDTQEKVWQQVLREMGGKYATLSMIPEDLSVN